MDGEGFEPLWRMTAKLPGANTWDSGVVVDGEGFEPLWRMTEKLPERICSGVVVDGEGFERFEAHRQQIYSLSPLATRESIRE